MALTSLMESSEGLLASKGKEFECFSEVQSTINELSTKFSHPSRIFNSQTAEDANRKREVAGSTLAPIDAHKWKYAYLSYR